MFVERTYTQAYTQARMKSNSKKSRIFRCKSLEEKLNQRARLRLHAYTCSYLFCFEVASANKRDLRNA